MTKTNGKMMVSPRIDKLINYYVLTRNQRDEIKERHKKELAPTEHAIEVLALELIKEFDAKGIQSARTAAGTATLSSHDSASCSDPDLFLRYVREHDEYELINRHPNPTACKEFVQKHGKLPPGVKLNSKRTVRINSPREEIVL